ncbi:hypothetical protein PM082_015204 [Marasmius tenuissimus]|nr:hypothetical protein PM082_015204 [Marasmius tenuissimus]
MPPSSSSLGTTATTTTTSSSLFFTPPRTSPTTSPTTTHGTSKSKSKQILPRRTLTIPQIFRSSSASNSLPPRSPREACPPSPRASTMTRHFSNLRRLSFPKPLPAPVAVQPTTTTTTSPNSNYRPMKNESRCLQHITQGIYVAFEDDTKAFPTLRSAHPVEKEQLLTHSGHPFTHTIQIVRASAGLGTLSPPTISHHQKQNQKHLTLSALPRPHDQYEHQMTVLTRDPELTRITRELADIYLDESYFTPERTFTSGDNGVARLGSRQMRAAREFIRSAGTATTTGPRVLITAPRDHRTDVMSIVVCFLAWSTGKCPAEVVNGIERQRGVMGVWKECISRVGVEYIEEVVC